MYNEMTIFNTAVWYIWRLLSKKVDLKRSHGENFFKYLYEEMDVN